jgi:hypothetical protein
MNIAGAVKQAGSGQRAEHQLIAELLPKPPPAPA